MALSKKPTTGMKDILPAEMRVREYVMDLIRKTYESFGFSSIETPCVEHIGNLLSKQGGENEKLIFKILKRGEKLSLDTAKSEEDLVDSGLRYDLTLPLSRYFANNQNQLPSPFKALQMGSVWRADRPQKGRLRQFVQCDIDILGDPSCLAETELILATTALLHKLGFENYRVRINDRKILKAMAAFSGFPEEGMDLVFIILDKMDKIGKDGVKAELMEAGFEPEAVSRYLDLFEKASPDREGIRCLEQTLTGFLDPAAAENLLNILTCVEEAGGAEFCMEFDPTLVRGMSYYTGPIFEIEMEEFSSSVAGGGRYDEMIGKFTGAQTPACGFSIGFERIVTILLERDFKAPGGQNKTAFLVEKGMEPEKLTKVLLEAGEDRRNGRQVMVAQMNKNKKFQKEQLAKEGYLEFREFYAR